MPFFLALTTWAANASAQDDAAASVQDVDAETRTAARELARQGAEAYDQGDNEKAFDLFDRANALVRAPSITVMQARVLVRLGRWVEALDRYEETRLSPLGPTAPDAFRLAVADATSEGAALRARIPQLRIHVTTSTGKTAGLKVSIDGKPMPLELLDVDHPVDPGSHEVKALVPGYEIATRVVPLGEGEKIALGIELIPSRSVAVTAPSEPTQAMAQPQRAPQRDGMSSEEVSGWTLLGVGTTALIAGTVTGVIALGKRSWLEQNCPREQECPPGSQDRIDSYHMSKNISYVAFAVGVASVGAGGYLVLLGPRESSHVAAHVGLDGVALRGRF